MTSRAPDVSPSISTDYTYSELDIADGVPLAFKPMLSSVLKYLLLSLFLRHDALCHFFTVHMENKIYCWPFLLGLYFSSVQTISATCLTKLPLFCPMDLIINWLFFIECTQFLFVIYNHDNYNIIFFLPVVFLQVHYLMTYLHICIFLVKCGVFLKKMYCGKHYTSNTTRLAYTCLIRINRSSIATTSEKAVALFG